MGRRRHPGAHLADLGSGDVTIYTVIFCDGANVDTGCPHQSQYLAQRRWSSTTTEATAEGWRQNPFTLDQMNQTHLCPQCQTAIHDAPPPGTYLSTDESNAPGGEGVATEDDAL